MKPMTNDNRCDSEQSVIDYVPGRCGGEPCLAGTRIMMSHLERLVVRLGWSVERIWSAYPHVSIIQLQRVLGQWMNATNWRE